MAEQETQQEQVEQQAQAQAQPAEAKRTYVEDGTEFKGNMVSSCHVVVRGKLEGEVMAPELTVTESGSVVGNVNAETIRSEGVLAGTIEAEDLYLSGQVRNDTIIRAKSMEVKLSQEGGKLEVTFGECTLDVGEDPRAELQDGKSTSSAKQAEAKPQEQLQAASAEASSEADAQQASSGDNKDGGRKRKGKGKRGGAQASEQEEVTTEEPAVTQTNSQAPPAE